MLFFEMLKKLKKKRRKAKRNKAISLAITAWLFLYLTSKLSAHLKFGKPLMSQEYKRIL